VTVVVARLGVLGEGLAVRRPGEVDEAADLVGAGDGQSGVDHRDADIAAIGSGAEEPTIRQSEGLRQVRFGRADVDQRRAGHGRVEGHAQHTRQSHDHRQLHQRQFDGQCVDQRVLREHAPAEQQHQPQHRGQRPAIGPDDDARRAARQRTQHVGARLVEQPAQELSGR
jgi:hypothetical protein